MSKRPFAGDRLLGTANPLVVHIGNGTNLLGGMEIEDVAQFILFDPQAHIDALVEAGVLRRAIINVNGADGTYFIRDKPHTHEWRVIGPVKNDRLERIEIVCVTCPPDVSTNTIVPNRLPIEIPE